MGEQFVTGETIAGRWVTPASWKKGSRYSYDMLGERRSLTAADAQAYMVSTSGRPRDRQKPLMAAAFMNGPGISIKLSAPAPQPRNANTIG